MEWVVDRSGLTMSDSQWKFGIVQRVVNAKANDAGGTALLSSAQVHGLKSYLRDGVVYKQPKAYVAVEDETM